MPLLIRGLYYEGWRLAALRVTKAVFNVLAKELDYGEIAKVIATLPVPLRSLWPAKALEDREAV